MNNFPTQRLEVDINSVFVNKWNPNIQTTSIFKALVESVKQFGFIDSVLVREIEPEVYEIIDGEHKLQAAKELGYTKILIDNLGKISEGDAKSLTLIMNNTRGSDDVLKRAEILKQLDEGQLSLIPFDKEQIRNELRLLDFDFSQYDRVDTTEEEKNELEFPLAKMEQVMLELQKIRASTESSELRMLIESYMDIVRAFKLLLKK